MIGSILKVNRKTCKNKRMLVYEYASIRWKMLEKQSVGTAIRLVCAHCCAHRYVNKAVLNTAGCLCR